MHYKQKLQHFAVVVIMIFFPRTGALSFQTNLHQLELGNDDDDDENQHRNDDDE